MPAMQSFRVFDSGGNPVSGAVAGMPTDPNAQMSYVNGVYSSCAAVVRGVCRWQPTGGFLAGGPQPAAAAGGLGNSARSSRHPAPSSAGGMLGDRNMILPKGAASTVVSVRLCYDLPGLASCIVSQNVYSDNGKCY